MNATSTRLQAAMRRTEQLDLFPESARKVQEVADARQSSVTDLERAVAVDPVLSAQLLRLANSPFYGVSRSVASIEDAIMVVGFRATRQLALTLAVLGLARSDDPVRQGLWHHSVAIAWAASQLRCSRTLDEWFVAGLLHDVGRLVLLELEGQSYGPMLSAAGFHGLCEGETERFGFNHATFGGAILEDWGLPPALCDGVAAHHATQPPRDEVALTIWSAEQLEQVHLGELEAKAVLAVLTPLWAPRSKADLPAIISDFSRAASILAL